MNSLIEKPDMRSSDLTIVGLCFAGLIESRLGSIESARKHLGVARHVLIPERGGIDQFPSNVACPTCCIFNWVGLEFHAFENWNSLDSAVGRFIQILAAMGQWNAHLRVLGVLNAISSQTEEALHKSPTLVRFLNKHKLLFSSKSPLHRFIGSTCYEGANSISIQTRSHVVLLWIINKIIWELRNDLTLAAEFLDKLHRYLLSSDEPSPFGCGRTTKPITRSMLRTLTIVPIIGHVDGPFLPKKDPAAVDWTSSNSNANRHILRWWESIDMVELLHLLSEQSQRRVLCQLSAWLIGAQPGQNPTVLTRNDLEDLGEEMRLGWLDMIRERRAKAKERKEI